mmetsp:Transcript_69202/g.193526  ORF Transcript_69202/g.193526 Transcript_69202/m.193526 type:complete len:240 (-) Transcript_69202:321-1040(-)
MLALASAAAASSPNHFGIDGSRVKIRDVVGADIVVVVGVGACWPSGPSACMGVISILPSSGAGVAVAVAVAVGSDGSLAAAGAGTSAGGSTATPAVAAATAARSDAAPVATEAASAPATASVLVVGDWAWAWAAAPMASAGLGPTLLLFRARRLDTDRYTRTATKSRISTTETKRSIDTAGRSVSRLASPLIQMRPYTHTMISYPHTSARMSDEAPQYPPISRCKMTNMVEMPRAVSSW